MIGSNLLSSLSYYADSNLSANLTMELADSNVLAESLNGLKYDLLLLNVYALSCESLSNVSVGN